MFRIDGDQGRQTTRHAGYHVEGLHVPPAGPYLARPTGPITVTNQTSSAARPRSRQRLPAAAIRVTTAQPISHRAAARLDDVLSTILAATRAHWVGNVAAVRADGSAEALHQFRVGLRRFRSALKLFKTAIPKAMRWRLDRDARWLLTQTSLVRDLDVFLMQMLPAADIDRGEFDRLQSAALRVRRPAAQRARRAARSPRYRTSMRRLDGWLRRLTGHIGDRRQDKPADIVRSAIDRRLRKIRKRGSRFGNLTPSARHRVRIAIKKCRYSIEFVASLLPKHMTTRLGPIMKSLQHSLGTSNDLFTAKALIAQLDRSSHST